jgi:hypothetical protein
MQIIHRFFYWITWRRIRNARAKHIRELRILRRYYGQQRRQHTYLMRKLRVRLARHSPKLTELSTTPVFTGRAVVRPNLQAIPGLPRSRKTWREHTVTAKVQDAA